MDLNYLYHRRGKSLMMAARANCESARAAHLALANGYVAKIADAIAQIVAKHPDSKCENWHGERLVAAVSPEQRSA